MIQEQIYEPILLMNIDMKMVVKCSQRKFQNILRRSHMMIKLVLFQDTSIDNLTYANQKLNTTHKET